MCLLCKQTFSCEKKFEFILPLQSIYSCLQRANHSTERNDTKRQQHLTSTIYILYFFVLEVCRMRGGGSNFDHIEFFVEAFIAFLSPQ